MRPTHLLAITVLGVFLAPAAAAAATKDVTAGMPQPKAGDGWKRGYVDNAFYPDRVEIAQGSTLRVKIAGFHNVAFVPKGQRPPAFAGPDPANPVAETKDAAGAAFWFTGQPRIVVDPRVVFPQGPKEIDGSTFAGSGVAAEGTAPKPYAVKMTGKPGSYRFICSLHPGMKLAVTVKAKGARVASARDDARRAKAQYAAAIKKVKRLAAAKPPAGATVKAGNDAGTIAFFGFRNAKPTIKAGQAVTFKMSETSTEIHNVAFGPVDYLEALSRRFIAPVPGPGGLPVFTLAPEVIYPSDPPGASVAVDGANHGNGFFNTGLLDTDKASPSPDRAVVRFAKAGTYGYMCNVHPSMRGTVTVTQ